MVDGLHELYETGRRRDRPDRNDGEDSQDCYQPHRAPVIDSPILKDHHLNFV